MQEDHDVMYSVSYFTDAMPNCYHGYRCSSHARRAVFINNTHQLLYQQHGDAAMRYFSRDILAGRLTAVSVLHCWMEGSQNLIPVIPNRTFCDPSLVLALHESQRCICAYSVCYQEKIAKNSFFSLSLLVRYVS